MTLRELQPDALAALDAATARAAEVVDPVLLATAQSCIDCHVAGGPPPPEPRSQLEADVRAVIEQELIDVASMPDEVVVEADAHLRVGELADLVMASYILETRARLTIAADRLLGGLE